MKIDSSKITSIILFLLVIGTLTGASIYFFIQQLQFFRIILIISSIFVIYLLKTKNIKLNSLSIILTTWFSFYFVWTLFATLISALFFDTYDIKISSTINFFIMYILILNIIIYINYNNKLALKTIYNAIVFMFFIMAWIGVWEITTRHHLGVATFFEHVPDYIQFQTATFFTNPNDFMAIYTIMFLFIVGYLNITANQNTPLIYLFFTIVLTFSFINNSRLAMLVLLLSSIVIFFKKKKRIYFFSFIFLVIIGIYFYIKTYNSQNLEYLISGLSFGGESTYTRITLYKYAFFSIEDNYGIGYGIDNSASYYKTIKDSNLGGIINPHNYFLEILINSGLLSLLSYILINIIILFYFLKEKLFYLSYLLLIYPIILISSSSSLFLWFHYVYLIGLLGLYIYYKNNTRRKH